MAFYTDTIATRTKASSGFAFFNSIAGFFDRVIASQNRSVEVQRMQRLSDRELEDIGVNRDDIVRYVYRDIYHI
ncbi:MAG: DUF1127 domain-containing protein [Yoonia sp.]|uniref:DUF1127 domain-containing protein n=1 Tax=Yoonia sp. TaxID=2212373 RepID=UPI00273D4014|nr:DUF1127 domain-containing protein [Yoonia sp.]MDP5085315.1 DUF1127 domain-containing protein [Yoonia sp.]MDP5361995.1 DUF1127 domain-containing protein [Paracoccaceae bacterium]